MTDPTLPTTPAKCFHGRTDWPAPYCGQACLPPDHPMYRPEPSREATDPCAAGHSWYVIGDGVYEEFHRVCEECGTPDPTDTVEPPREVPTTCAT